MERRTETPSGTTIKTALTAEDTKFLAEWFRASHAEGWRPNPRTASDVYRVWHKLDALYSREGDGQLPLPAQ